MLDAIDRRTEDPQVEPFRVLDEDGTAHDRARRGVDLSLDEIGELYAVMAMTRALDQEFVNLQRQGQLALFPSCRGQEAAQIGSIAALCEGDWVFPQYREHGVLIYRGVDPVEIGLQWRGATHGSRQMVERRCAPLSVPIATHALHAVGYAMGAALDSSSDLAIAYIGDGATSEGDAHEALNFAAVFDAPCIFLVQNNHWAISVPYHRQTRSATVASKAAAYGIPGRRCDGNDLLATWAVTRDAAERARAGLGPTLVEAVTYRMGSHTTSDDPLRYRDPSEVKAWEGRDPLLRVQRFLEREHWLGVEQAAAVDERAEAACARLRAGVYEAPDPDPAGVFDHVLTTPTPELRRQARQLQLERSEAGAP